MDGAASISRQHAEPSGEPTKYCYFVEVEVRKVEDGLILPDTLGLFEVLIERYAAFVDEEDLLEWMANLYSGACYLAISPLLTAPADSKPPMYQLANSQQVEDNMKITTDQPQMSSYMFYLEADEQLAVEELLAAMYDAAARELVLHPQENQSRGLSAIVIKAIDHVEQW